VAAIHILKQADIFYDLTAAQLELIASVAREQQYRLGDVVFEEKSAGDELYVIAAGEIDIQLDLRMLESDYVGAPKSVARLRRGQSFGEIALVDEGLRSARAVCAYDGTKLLIIPREELMHLCQTFPQMGYRLMRNLAADLAMKIRNADIQLRSYLTYQPKSSDT
jgi:CRP/FNR family transcriptional regulator, cyclic AMP receptor protein